MSNTIKVIDLLNKMANGEELPEEIKYDNTIWQYNKAKNDYYQDIGSTKLYFFAELVVYNKDGLNDTVEIIEEQEEIDIQDINNRLKRLENMVDRFEYIEKRVETIDSQSGIFRYC